MDEPWVSMSEPRVSMSEPKVLHPRDCMRFKGVPASARVALGSSRGAPEAVLEPLWGLQGAVLGAFWNSGEAPAVEKLKINNSLFSLRNSMVFKAPEAPSEAEMSMQGHVLSMLEHA